MEINTKKVKGGQIYLYIYIYIKRGGGRERDRGFYITFFLFFFFYNPMEIKTCNCSLIFFVPDFF